MPPGSRRTSTEGGFCGKGLKGGNSVCRGVTFMGSWVPGPGLFKSYTSQASFAICCSEPREFSSLMSLRGKSVLLIIGGGIAAYKALELTRLLRKAGVAVRPI